MNFRRHRVLCGGLILLAGTSAVFTTTASKSLESSHQAQTRKIDSWLDFSFDANAPMGDAKNPAVILPASAPTMFAEIAGAKRIGELLVVPAAGFQKVVKQPLMGNLFGATFGRLSNVKSFDGFSAIDNTGFISDMPSLLLEAPNRAVREITGENSDVIRRQLRDGDLVFGSHVINFMTWGRYNHVAIVIDASRGVLAESTAQLPTDMPGVRLIDWKTFAAGYAHVGLVRIRGLSSEQQAGLVRWLQDRKGRPYRWPLIQGLDKTDQKRFYCSQLVWMAFKDVMNLDLDVDKGVLVFPDDIYNSKEHVDIVVP